MDLTTIVHIADIMLFSATLLALIVYFAVKLALRRARHEARVELYHPERASWLDPASRDIAYEESKLVRQEQFASTTTINVHGYGLDER